MSRDKHIFVGESEYTTDTTNEELAEHLVINKGYAKASEVAREIFEEIEEMLKGNEAVCENKRLADIPQTERLKFS